MSLNWKELERQTHEIQSVLEGTLVQKIYQSGSFAQGEAVLIHGYGAKRGAWRLLFCLKNMETFWGLLPDSVVTDKTDSASTFIMVMRKHFLGERIEAVQQFLGERMVVIHFGNGKALLSELIPRRANLLVMDDWDRSLNSGKCLASFQQVSLESGGRYSAPPAKAFEVKNVRDFSDQPGDSFNDRLLSYFLARLSEGKFSQEKQNWLTLVKNAEKKIRTALTNSACNARKTENVDSYRKQALVLQENLFKMGPKNFPQSSRMSLRGLSEDSESISVELDPKLSYSQNVDRLFKQVKKFSRAKEELSQRISELQKKLESYQKMRERIEALAEADELEKLRPQMIRLKLLSEDAKRKYSKKGESASQAKPYLEVVSGDGFVILCGRNQNENREVTFRGSSSSDVWMHAKGIPGAHVVIRAQKNKTVPLSTLLEAAQLTLYYSKIRKGKKADVDYTFRKNVRAIKGTLAEVTYTDNKTIFVESDVEVVKRLLRESEEVS